jgi:hypothetical protein
MNPKLLFAVLGPLFISTSLAGTSTNSSQTKTVNQPQPISAPKSNSTTAPVTQSSSNNQKKFNMADFCKEHTC